MLISRDRLTELLRNVVDSIDIPDDVYEEATLKYEDIGEWLSQQDSELRSYSPQIYPQGSFRLGTVIQPVSPDCEYDIDLVCLLGIPKYNTTQEKLKRLIGDRLKKRKDLAAVVHEGRRCWTLNYPGQFHLDVLPSIPNSDKPPTGILLSDRELRNWQKSNPIAYADWFYAQMSVVFEQRRALAAKASGVSIEEVPRWAVKTPLQRSVQLLKRHRDILFQSNQEVQPISIVITTLAAQAYDNQPDVLTATTEIVDAIMRDLTSANPKMIQKRDGLWWIHNPVDENENFADKWNEYPERREAFANWIRRVIVDVQSAQNSATPDEAARRLAPIFGQPSSRLVAPSSRSARSASTKALSIPSASEIIHCQRPAWPLQPVYTATISGTAHLKKQGKKLWPIADRELPKNVWLKFVLKTTTPPPFTIKWQVVNTGKEAAAASGLRGDFYDGNDTNTVRWESTEYRGTHWIEAFVIKNGVCVARSGRKYVRIR